MSTAVYFIHAISPLHPGIGHGAGDLDLPIARERATNLPYFPGSSLKGALRAGYKGSNAVALFGPDTQSAHEHAGSLQISDARLLFFPVRSLAGVFAYVTSPLLLRRYQRDMVDALGVEAPLPALPKLQSDTCLVSNESVLVHDKTNVWIEDFRLAATADPLVTSFASIGDRLGIDDFTKRVCVVTDDVLSFLVTTATEVTARIRLDEEKLTVAKGALWYEEALPAETILTGVALSRSIATKKGPYEDTQALADLRTYVGDKLVLQLGGHATVGRGICRLWLGGGK